tara:strand:+ start:7203 stop:7955 length:753 start_codon:yes stop_codon:yes gene_type:complete
MKLQCFWKVATVLNFSWDMCLYSKEEDRYVSGSIHGSGSWEKDMVIQMLQTMKKYTNSTLLDIGGNVGYYTLAAAAAGFSVNVFEPVPANAAMIQQSIYKNKFENIMLHTSALGAKLEEIGMGITKSNNQGGVHHSKHIKSTTMIPSIPMDYILKSETKPLYIKIDIEGEECNALNGMKQFLSSSRKIIGVNMEFGQSRTKCCSQWMQPEGFFHLLHSKHNLCPLKHKYDNICSVNVWDLVWETCTVQSF